MDTDNNVSVLLHDNTFSESYRPGCVLKTTVMILIFNVEMRPG